jgi:hypothetical protein
MKALILASQGERGELHGLVEQFSAQMDTQSTNPEFLGFGAFVQSELLLADRQFKETIDFVDRRVGQLESYGARFFLPQLRLSRGRALRALGQLPEARTVLEQAHQASLEIGLPLTTLSILQELITVAEQADEPGRLPEYRRAARELIEFLSAHIEDELLRTSFRNLPHVQTILAT